MASLTTDAQGEVAPKLVPLLSAQCTASAPRPQMSALPSPFTSGKRIVDQYSGPAAQPSPSPNLVVHQVGAAKLVPVLRAHQTPSTPRPQMSARPSLLRSGNWIVE